MSSYRILNLLYMMVVVSLLGFTAYAYNALQSGNNDDMKFLWSIAQATILPSCGGGSCSSAGGGEVHTIYLCDPSAAAGFHKQEDQASLNANFVSSFKVEVPSKVKLVSSYHQRISCQTYLTMFKVEGSFKDLKMMAGSLACERIYASDKTIDKAAKAFSATLPQGWREMRLYRGVLEHNGYDLRVYLDEANNCAYITAQRMSNVLTNT